MKKIAVIMMGMMLSLMLLAGCDMLAPGGNIGGTESGGSGETAEKTPLESVEEKYGKLSEAKEIVQTIDVAHGELTQYASEKTYTKAGSGYRVTGSERRLNMLSSGKTEAYTETPIETTVKAGTFSVRLDLDELYFSTAPVFEGGTMEVGISDSSVETVFGIGEELSAPVHGLRLKIVTDETHVTGMQIAYSSGSNEVEIALRFGY